MIKTLKMRRLIKELREIADVFDGSGESDSDIGDLLISKAAALTLLITKTLPANAVVVCAEYGECLCDNVEEGHICLDEVTLDDLENLASDDGYNTFAIWR